jgi:hypothetical protein
VRLGHGRRSEFIHHHERARNVWAAQSKAAIRHDDPGGRRDNGSGMKLTLELDEDKTFSIVLDKAPEHRLETMQQMCTLLDDWAKEWTKENAQLP